MLMQLLEDVPAGELKRALSSSGTSFRSPLAFSEVDKHNRYGRSFGLLVDRSGRLVTCMVEVNTRRTGWGTAASVSAQGLRAPKPSTRGVVFASTVAIAEINGFAQDFLVSFLKDLRHCSNLWCNAPCRLRRVLRWSRSVLGPADAAHRGDGACELRAELLHAGRLVKLGRDAALVGIEPGKISALATTVAGIDQRRDLACGISAW